jgi:small subunit ribosomal protein S17
MSVGTVVKVSGINTVVVKIERSYVHPIYKKRIKDFTKLMAHDTLGVKVGDKVRVVEVKPISKRKRHKIEVQL